MEHEVFRTPSYSEADSNALIDALKALKQRYILADVYISLKSILMRSREKGLATPCSEAILKAFAL